MPTDFIVLAITGASAVSMTLARSGGFAPRDGLDTGALAAAAGAAITLLLIAVNIATLPLGIFLPATVVPITALICGAVVVLLTHSALAKFAGNALKALLNPLLPAITIGVLSLAAFIALIAPPQNPLHAAVTAIGAGFGFSLLLQLGVRLDAALLQRQAARLGVLQLPQYRDAVTLFTAALLAMALLLVTAWS